MTPDQDCGSDEKLEFRELIFAWICVTHDLTYLFDLPRLMFIYLYLSTTFYPSYCSPCVHVNAHDIHCEHVYSDA